MKHKLKRVLSITLALAMGLTSISTSAFAEEETQTDVVTEVVSSEDAETSTGTELAEEIAEEAEASEEASDDGSDDTSVEIAFVDDADVEAEPADKEAEDEDSSGKSFNADIVLSDVSSAEEVKSVKVQATADDEEDTYGYIFFWQYDGTFPDDASAWANYFNTPYAGISVDEIDDDFSEIYLPVTLEDGSEGSASAEMIHSSEYSCVAFDMPAGSSMNTTLSLSLKDVTEDDLYIMLESAYVDSYKNEVITTDYLPLEWEGQEVENADEEEEIPFDDDDEFPMTEEETETEVIEKIEEEFESEEIEDSGEEDPEFESDDAESSVEIETEVENADLVEEDDADSSIVTLSLNDLAIDDDSNSIIYETLSERYVWYRDVYFDFSSYNPYSAEDMSAE